MTVAPAHLVQRVKLALQVPDHSPLDYYRHAVPQLKEALSLLVGDDPVDELGCRAANKSAKSYGLAAVVLAMLQKRRELDGVPLPQWRGPVSGLALTLDYEQQKLSTQPHILKLLGKWPHRARWKNGDILSSLRVQPVGGNDDQSTWSELSFMSQENKRAGVGARRDIVWGDEPPIESIWREIRKAGHAGRRNVRLLGFTPTIRRQWQWLKDEYGETPRGQTRRINEDWAECRWSLRDNSALSGKEIEKLLREFKKDPLFDARVYGDYIDASGDCPFDLEILHKMLAECVEPEVVEWRITREVPTEEDGGAWLAKVVTTVPVDVFKHSEIGKTYYINVDSSAGIKSPKHDPGALEVAEVGSGDLVALYDGALGSYGLGVLAAGLARQYNDATVDPETTGGWGEGVLRGLADSGYGNVARQRRELRPGEWHTELGFKTTVTTRPAMISAVQAWVEAWGQGIKYARCPSEKVIQTLIDTILDSTGKPVAASGHHDEHLILFGQKLRKAVKQMSRFIPPEAPRVARDPEELLIAAINAARDEDGSPFGQVAARPRLRPKM